LDRGDVEGKGEQEKQKGISKKESEKHYKYTRNIISINISSIAISLLLILYFTLLIPHGYTTGSNSNTWCK
jgi:hypothetical protein